MQFVYLVVLALMSAVIWINVARRPERRRAKLDPTDAAQGALMDRSKSPRPEDRPVGSARDEGPSARNGPDEEPDFPVEQPEMEDDLTDIPNGAMPVSRDVAFTPDAALEKEFDSRPAVAFQPDFEVGEELGLADWSLLDDHDELPADYGEDVITAIVRNPRSLYVFWERSGGGEQRLREMLGEAAYRETIACLRVFDLTATVDFTIDVGDRDEYWFIHGLEPRHRYSVSYGRRRRDGHHYLLALSTPVTTPPESPEVPERSQFLYDRLEKAIGHRGMAPSSPRR